MRNYDVQSAFGVTDSVAPRHSQFFKMKRGMFRSTATVVRAVEGEARSKARADLFFFNQ